jgi:hypothetical protein
LSAKYSWLRSYVIDQLLGRENQFGTHARSARLDLNDVLRSASELSSVGFEDLLILTNIKDLYDHFWTSGVFAGRVVPPDDITLPEGYLAGLPVYSYYGLPQGMTFIWDRASMGSLLIKKDFTVEISDFTPSEKQSLLARPEFASLDFDEKVNLTVEEIVKFAPGNLGSLAYFDTRASDVQNLT